jgi:formate--tetrahydrofolate ligase
MALDPTKHADWEIAEEAESRMKTVYELGEQLGLDKEELLPHGHYLAKLDYRKILDRLKDRPDGKYVDVTAITPTPLGEGKSTCAMGLVQGLGKRGKSVIGAIRQPSGGPTMNIKGSAAGGGLAQCVPLTPFSLGMTGDINAIMNAHNLGMVALTSRMQHECNYTDKQLAKRNLKRLDIHPKKVEFRWDGLLRPSFAQHHHGSGRQDGRHDHAVRLQHRGQFRDHGYFVHCQGFERHAREDRQDCRGL